MNVLVTGGTGFVGREILRELHRAGHEIHILSRRGHTAAAYAIEAEFDGQIHTGDVVDGKYLAEACAGIDAVIHLVGIISEAGAQTYENVHARGTEHMVSAAQRAGVKRFVHMSALGVRPHAAARYHRSKWTAEEIVRGSGLNWTVFRPSIIYGPRDGFVNLFANFIRRLPIVPIIGKGTTRFQPVAVGNVASAFAKSLTEPRATGQTFDLCGADTFTLEEMVDEILAAMKKTRRKIHIPIPLAWVQGLFLEVLLGKVLRRAPPLNRDQVRMLQEDNVGNGRPAEELFGLAPVKFRDGIRSYLEDAP